MKITVVDKNTPAVPKEDDVELRLTVQESYGIPCVRLQGRKKNARSPYWNLLCSFSPTKSGKTRVATASGNMRLLGFPAFYNVFDNPKS